MKAAIEAIGYLVLSPIVGGLIALSLSLGLHWISGEGDVIGSGDPWLVIGAMLFFPAGILVGLAFGLVGAINTIYLARNRTQQ